MSDLSLIGLAAMGRALAQASIDAGHHLTVWNRFIGLSRQWKIELPAMTNSSGNREISVMITSAIASMR